MYDMYGIAVKRAEKLVRKNFAVCLREAHRLAAIGLPISIGEESIRLLATYGVTDDTVDIAPEGVVVSRVKFWECNAEPVPGQTDWYESEGLGGGSVCDIAFWLEAQLEGLESRADLLGEVAEEMGKTS